MEKPDNQWDVWLRIPPDTFYLGLVRKMIVDIARRAGFHKKEVDKIEIAVDEACSSVIRHSQKVEEKISTTSAENEIQLQVRISQDEIEIFLAGKGEPLEIPSEQDIETEELLEKMNLSELGIYVIRNFMDVVEYKRDPARGNVLRLVKYLRKADEEKKP